MKSLWQSQKNRAFTLVELLVVIAIIGILAALLLPALLRGKQRAQRIECIGQLKQMGTAFQIFAHDHRSRFPMQTPIAEGGSQEYVTAGNSIPGTFYFAYRHFQTLANELVTPRVLVCPADLAREKAESFGTLQNSNVSYFVGVYADYNTPETILAGDRNITNDVIATASLVRGTKGLRWTEELHAFKGNVLYADSHVAELNNARLDLQSAPAATANFFLPAVKTPVLAGGPQPTSPGPSPSQPGADPSAGTTTAPAQPSGPVIAASSATPSYAGASQQSPQTPMPFGNSMSSSGTPKNHDTSSTASTFSEANAKETRGDSATNVARIAAPADDDDGGTPLLWLQGAAKATYVKAGGWLWLLLLALLIAAAAYGYSRWKKRETAKYQNASRTRDAFSEDDE